MASAAEAEHMICSRITVDRKKCEVRACTKEIKVKSETTIPPKSLGGMGMARVPKGRWQAGTPSITMARPVPGGPRPQFAVPIEPAVMRTSGPTQAGCTTIGCGIDGTVRGAPRVRMPSNVCCYRCGLMGHLLYTCTSSSRRVAPGVENG